ncbi:MAG: hypothetical protein CO137_02595 [Candidatus Magasanikbacteria bacterium CG_4_9_14_3_um_filter_32_9]|uniref:Uncharacterized protein n=1 Tax=Candidatus Magasanikbacteria bacterium CG_4_9_14_3_um_filter_32_9 TaxID=1974644 RepID=A0A2M7Z6I6_9BACT|nr:MAG: hypothetical protein CO137_02595 [Candidatus Magasanikbacteria bacterium CG_4_9_14_3_um_filter_32_9]
MEFKKIYLGNWFPGSTIHLKQLYQLLSTGESFYFQKGEVVNLVKKMKIKNVEYITQAFNKVKGSFDGNLEFDVLEDGVSMISKDISSLNFVEFKKLRELAKKNIFFVIEKVYSRGVSIPRVLDELQVDNPAILVVSKAKEKDLEKIFKTFNSIPYKKLSNKKGDIWIGGSYIVINNQDFSEEELAESIKYLMFARLFELNLNRSLKAQQNLWTKLEDIRSQKYLKNKELPIVRDSALDIHNQVIFFKSRSNQMNHFLDWRKQYVDDYLNSHFLNSTFREFFVSLKANQYYLHELWEMAGSYADSTIKSISLLYIDNERKELRTLQKLFLISAVITFLSLGTLLGSTMTTYNTKNEVTSYAIINSWEQGSFILFAAIALFIAFFIYYIFYLFFNKLKQSEILSRQKSKK